METRLNAPFGAVTFIVKFWDRVKANHFDRKVEELAPPSDHIAKDIGLSPHEVERLRLQWPSQTMRHPYL